MTPEAFVAHLRTWKGVPYLHQGRTRAGADCAGYVQIAPTEVGLMLDVPLYNDYERTPDGRMLVLCRKHLIEAPPQPGGVFVMAFDTEPQHMGFFADYRGSLSIIHALNRNKCVVEHRLDRIWRDRIVATFIVPGVSE